MRRVIAPANHGSTTGQAPCQRDERGVEDRNEKDKDGEDCRRYEAPLHARRREEAGRGEEHAEQMAASIAHEDRGRRKVVDQKTQYRADERRDAEGQRRTAVGKQERQVAQPGKRGDARGEAVHVVEQIEGVRDRNNPHEREKLIDHGPARDR